MQIIFYNIAIPSSSHFLRGAAPSPEWRVQMRSQIASAQSPMQNTASLLERSDFKSGSKADQALVTGKHGQALNAAHTHASLPSN